MHEIAGGQLGIITTSQLAGDGVDRQQIWRRRHSGLLVAVYPGLYRLAGAPSTWAQDLFAACAWGGGPPGGWARHATAAASHRAAARLHGLSGFERATVEITTLKQPRFAATVVIAHQGKPDTNFVTLVDRIPVTNVVRTLVHLAALLDARDPLDGRSTSEFRKGLRRLILGAGFPFVEEYRIPGLPYRSDLGTDDYLAVVEADGKKHHSGNQD